MKPRARPTLSAAFVALTLLSPVTTAAYAQVPAATGPQTGLRVERLTIATPRGARVFQVEMADTPGSREIGMMWRTSVPRGTGMLFDFKTPQQVYIRADGTIANIAANAPPLSRAIIPSSGPIVGVLEIGAGEARRLGLASGQRVTHAIFRRQVSRR
jgi:uncharacterized protein